MTSDFSSLYEQEQARGPALSEWERELSARHGQGKGVPLHSEKNVSLQALGVEGAELIEAEPSPEVTPACQQVGACPRLPLELLTTEAAVDGAFSVCLRELLEKDDFYAAQYQLPLALGRNEDGKPVIADLADMGHTLVAGTTGSGKSMCLRSMIVSMLYRFGPDELKLMLMDSRGVEMLCFRDLPHLVCPIVTAAQGAVAALRWAVNEVEHRYALFRRAGVRHWADYNARAREQLAEEEALEDESESGWIERFARDLEQPWDEEPLPLLPRLVIVIDGLAEFMITRKEEQENFLIRLTQKASAAGVHLVLATQTPRSKVLSGIIKAQIPGRISFRMASLLDSRVVLYASGAEKLRGCGELLFAPAGASGSRERVQGAYVSDAEIAAVVRRWSSGAPSGIL